MTHNLLLRHSLRSMRHPLALAVALALGAPFSATHAAIPIQPPDAGMGGRAMAMSRMMNPAAMAGSAHPVITATPPTPTMLPSLNNVAAGGVTFSTVTGTAPVLTVDQSTKGAIIEWNSFDIGSGSTVNFTNASYGKSSVTLNRVIGPNPSQIYGRLNSVGSVFLIDPSGITFAAGSSINVGGLVASTLDISNTNFNNGVTNGSYVFGTGVLQQGNIDNFGTITASTGGTVALLGGRVENDLGASIDAPQGTVALGVGSQITVNIGGDGLTQLQINTGATNLNGTYATNNGTLAADGGQVLMQALGNPFTQVVNDGVIHARSLTSRAGRIVLSSDSDDGTSNTVYVQGGTMDVSGGSGIKGGSIAVSGYNVEISTSVPTCPSLPCTSRPSLLDASGGAGGGTISVDARNVAEIDGLSTLSANAITQGNGGSINVNGSNGLYAFGAFNASGGTSGGNGGKVVMSGSGLDARGVRVNAGGANGTAGTWTFQAPGTLTLTHDNTQGTLPTGFTPLTTWNVQDAVISNALNNNTSVTIGAAGNINFDQNVTIERTTGTTPLTLELDAHAKIVSGTAENENISIVAGPGTGPLNMLFDSDADGLLGFGNGGITLGSLTLLSNGGNIDMYGQRNAATGYSGGLYLNGPLQIDTRVNGSDTAAAGNVLMRGHGGGYTGVGADGVILGYRDYNGPIVINTGTGNIDVVGVGDNGGDGILLATTNVGPLQLITSSGHIALTGYGSTYASPFGGSGNGNGISTSVYFNGNGGPFTGVSLQTDSGTIDLRGYGLADSNLGNGTILTHNGINLGAGTQLGSNTGSILLTGSSLGSGIGIDMLGGLVPNSTTSTLIDAGSGNIILRSHNNPASRVSSLQIGDDVVVRTSNTIDIRGGSVSATGGIVENPNDAIVIGASDTFGGGIDINDGDLAQLISGTLVLGSDIQVGNVTVSGEAGNIAYGGNLSLYAGGGGSVQLNGGSVDVGNHTLALVASGDVTQNGAIVAGSLLAISNLGNVQLTNTANRVSAHTIGGHAAGTFTFYNSGDVGIGTVNATGFSAGSNASNALSASGISAGGAVLVRSMGGNMLLNGNVSGSTVNLVTGPNGFFINPLGSTINASDYWRVWASGWSGETRGGLAGNGTLPNLYGCSFGTTCAVTPSNGANQFIYTARPTATIDIADAMREYGLPNGLLGYTVGGLILGDQAANAINGNIFTGATQASNVGNYAINGSFISPAGYLVNVLPGTLDITPATLTYTADPFTRITGTPNGILDGTVTGFRNGDTLSTATNGTLIFQSPAGTNSPLGIYGIYGGGLSASNYRFVQANGNAVALTILPPIGTYSLDFMRDEPVTYVYDRNFGIVGLCPATDLASGSRDKDGDTLAREWSRVRSRPNLANCVATKQKNSCGDF